MPVYGYEISIPDAVSWPLCRVLGLILLWMPMFYQQAGSDELMHDNVRRCRIKLPAERAKCGSPSFQIRCPCTLKMLPGTGRLARDHGVSGGGGEHRLSRRPQSWTWRMRRIVDGWGRRRGLGGRRVSVWSTARPRLARCVEERRRVRPW